MDTQLGSESELDIKKKDYCQCCGRQLVNFNISNGHAIGGNLPTRVINGYCCHECADELDEYGLYPEEILQMESIYENDERK